MSDETVTKDEPLEVAEFKSMSKQEMIDHLKDFHFDGKNLLPYAWSSYTKDDFVRIHADMHAGRWAQYRRGQEMSNSMIPHTHSTPETAGKLTATVQEQLDALGIDKPLTSQQKKHLLDLLNNDFATLRAEIDVYGDNLLAERKEAAKVKGEAKLPILNKYRDQARDARAEYDTALREIQRKYEERCSEILADAEKEGIVSGYGSQTHQSSSRIQHLQIKGLDTEFREIEKEVRTEIAVAQNVLQREKLASTRKIMLAAIPRDSAKLIDKMPSAAALMANAASQREAAKQLEAASK